MHTPLFTAPFCAATCLLGALLTAPGASVFAQANRLSDNIDNKVVSQAQRVRVIDEIVAVVDRGVITRNELNQQMQLAVRQLRQANVALPRQAELERQVLERIILERAQLQEARENALRIDDTQLDRAITRIAEQNNVNVQGLRDRVEADGTPFARFREDIRQEILPSRLREREVDNRVQVSEAEIDAFLSEQGANPRSQEQEFNLAQILLRLPENASPEQIEQTRRKAEGLLNELRSGADFARMAASQSNAAEALKGGELGWRALDRLPQLFVDAVQTLKAGELAPLVRSPNGFHIIKVLDRRSTTVGGTVVGAPPVQQTRARHILIRVNELVSQQEAQRRLRDLKQRLDNKAADFADLARQFSVDGSATKGGDLGWIYPGDTVPEFERAMDTLKPGEVSSIIESPFGFHLIQVLERRTQELSADRQRLLARQAIRERKGEEAYQEWLRQLRDRAYVEIRL